MSMKSLFAAIGLAVSILLPAASAQDQDLSVLAGQTAAAAPSEVLHAWLMDEVREATERRDAAYEKIKTPEEIAAYQKRMRDFFVEQLGGFPDRTPLNARVVGREQRDGYRIEKVIFESQPKHFVTAILYLPEVKPPYPGVLVPCGHSANGKARDLYQRAPILIAKSGMAALCYDPIDQGERHQLLDASGKPLVTSSTMGHGLAGVGAVLLGRNTATYRVWDGIRAIDYLASRPEVDSQRIGCTGISGGGTLTSYLMALDDRIQAAAPGCYLTSFRRLLETVGPQDAEQTIFSQIAFGLDHADYVLIRAPRPTLMMVATADYFDIDGAWHSFRQAKRWYGRFGHAERMDLVEVDGGHGFPAPMREAAARWMRRWLLGIDDAITEPEFPVAADEALWCTPRGEVMLLDGARSVYDLNAELEEKLAAERKSFWETSEKAKALDEVRRITGIRRLSDLPETRWEKRGEVRRAGYRIEKIVLHPDRAIPIPALLLVPDGPASGAALYLDAAGKQKEAAPGGALEQLARGGQIVLAPDLCGLGETAPAGKHSYASFLPPEWREATIAYLLGESLLAIRCEEILLCARFLAGYGEPAAPRPIQLTSIGRVGPPTLHAAALEADLFATVTLRNSLVSWSNVVHTPLTKNQNVNLVHGALRKYDLPDLVKTLPEEKITLIEPLDAAEKQL
ncbi:MAG: acetylxylan esterase [Thermoguttaceae bacterium]|nr:acetylxylan esterase [Thermoguttaceae bacterium]MDI9445317.1 acetylxylan esterase [Planctomycetota bacterium]